MSFFKQQRARRRSQAARAAATKTAAPIDIDELSPEQLQEFRLVFNLFDSDSSGAISATELGTVMKSVGLKPTERELAQMIQDVDKDGSGEIEFEEFLHLMAKKFNDTQLLDQIHDVFRTFDHDGDGVLSRADLVWALKTYAGVDMTEDEAAEVMHEVDEDGTGFIDPAEFILMISNPM
eukprot:TRINITY_DN3318_c0_g1_i1.p1 TRINITY_DN3318_c0_g1~~TRINITY_DN3318_c0_g1_i1.p1  ORF type:complete len:205 (+),score=76.72 TRINITY_DN3318_c0_g1_i1:79-615(+)